MGQPEPARAFQPRHGSGLHRILWVGYSRPRL